MGLFGRVLTWQVLPRNSLKNGGGVVGVHGLLFIRYVNSLIYIKFTVIASVDPSETGNSARRCAGHNHAYLSFFTFN